MLGLRAFMLGAAQYAMSQPTNTGSGWSLKTLLTNLNKSLYDYGNLFLIVLGVIMIIVAIVKIAKGLMTGGRNGQTNWVLNIVLFFFGGLLAVSGGFNLLSKAATGSKETLDELMMTGNYIMPLLQMLW